MSYRVYIWRKNNPSKRLESKKRILPKPGNPMNEEQQKIYNQIGNNDFSYWDTMKNRKGHNGGPQTHVKIKPPEYLIWYRAKSNAKKRNKVLFNKLGI